VADHARQPAANCGAVLWPQQPQNGPWKYRSAASPSPPNTGKTTAHRCNVRFPPLFCPVPIVYPERRITDGTTRTPLIEKPTRVSGQIVAEPGGHPHGSDSGVNGYGPRPTLWCQITRALRMKCVSGRPAHCPIFRGDRGTQFDIPIALSRASRGQATGLGLAGRDIGFGRRNVRRAGRRTGVNNHAYEVGQPSRVHSLASFVTMPPGRRERTTAPSTGYAGRASAKNDPAGPPKTRRPASAGACF